MKELILSNPIYMFLAAIVELALIFFYLYIRIKFWEKHDRYIWEKTWRGDKS